MPSLEILDLAIGLIVFFTLFSVVCSAITESVISWLKLRPKHLRAGIEAILDEDLTKKFFENRRIESLVVRKPKVSRGTSSEAKRSFAPSYLEPETFSSVLISILAPQTSADPTAALEEICSEIREAKWVDSLPQDPKPCCARRKSNEIAEVVGGYAQSKGLSGSASGVERAKEAIEFWFNESQNRRAGQFKREASWITLLTAAALVLAINADTLVIADHFAHSEQARVEAVDTAEALSGEDTVKEREEQPSAEEVVYDLDALSLPLGWNHSAQLIHDECGKTIGAVLMKSVGLLLTIALVSLGAPFWFQVLRKIVDLRSSGKAAVDDLKKLTGAKGSKAGEDGGSGVGTSTPPKPVIKSPPSVAEAFRNPGGDLSLGVGFWLAVASDYVYSESDQWESIFTPWRLTSAPLSIEGTDDFTDTQAVLLSHRLFTALVFRGTEKEKEEDLLVDLDAIQSDLPGRNEEDGKAHRGFLRAFNAVKWELPQHVPNDRPFFICGHSLGGALAALAALELAENHDADPILYTYGQPLVGDAALAIRISEACNGRWYRFTNADDIVPEVPRLFGYQHAGLRLHFTSSGRLVRDPSNWSQVLATGVRVSGRVADAEDVRSQIRSAVSERGAAHASKLYISNIRRALLDELNS